ncbi:citrulline utilization hydrolase CtlX [Glaciihabitans arcticus]|nr:arginine deiminase-related protein [Glaciihabitans arcticus]
MIRPHHFTPNPATAADNAFQVDVPADDSRLLAAEAYREVTAASVALADAGITVHLFEDEDTTTPDSVFPNNWFSTHSGGHVAIYPMHSPSRRTERRSDVIELLKHDYRVQDVIDYSGLEYDDVFLEGTGAMVLDHASRIAYAARSNRADPIALERFCTNFGYEPMVFDAADSDAVRIYHTNVLMCIATDFALIGAELLTDERRRQQVLDRIAAPGREIITLREDQVRNFAGNAIELRGSAGRVLALSSRAYRSLDPAQIGTIEQYARLVPLDVPTIELAGGSVRCMLAGIHLDRR